MKSSTGRWVSGDDFFDRKGELPVLESRVRDGNHLVVTGQGPPVAGSGDWRGRWTRSLLISLPSDSAAAWILETGGVTGRT